MIPDAPMPMSLVVEPVLPQYQQAVSEIMREYGGDYTGGTAFYPKETGKVVVPSAISSEFPPSFRLPAISLLPNNAE